MALAQQDVEIAAELESQKHSVSSDDPDWLVDAVKSLSKAGFDDKVQQNLIKSIVEAKTDLKEQSLPMPTDLPYISYGPFHSGKMYCYADY